MSGHRSVPVPFRTPQHPSLGTNHWGGASPLLARDIPKESLEQRYVRLNSVRTRDEIFPDDFDYWVAPADQIKQDHYASKTPSRSIIRELLPKFVLFRRKQNGVDIIGSCSSKKKRWLPRLDRHNRWPQGWC